MALEAPCVSCCGVIMLLAYQYEREKTCDVYRQVTITVLVRKYEHACDMLCILLIQSSQIKRCVCYRIPMYDVVQCYCQDQVLITVMLRKIDL